MPALLILERMLSLFVLAQAAHIARWRLAGPPARYLFWFFKLWIVVPACAIALWIVVSALRSGAFDRNDAVAWLGALTGYGALCGAYVMIYPAISELSPSLEIVRTLARAPGAAMAIASIKIPTVGGRESVAHRVSNLLASGFVAGRDDDLELTASGKRIAALLEAFRAILGIAQRTGG